MLDGVVAERDRNWQLLRIEFAGGELWVRDGGDALGQSIRIRVLARDVSLAMSSHDDSSIINRLSATVTELEADQDPAMLLAKLSLGERSLIARISRRSAHHLGIEIGTALWAQIKSVAILR